MTEATAAGVPVWRTIASLCARRQGKLTANRVFETSVADVRSRNDCSQLRQEVSVLFFAARDQAVVSPPPTLMRFSDNRMPCVGIGARFELSVLELTPIQEISETAGHIRSSDSGSSRP